MRRRMRMFLVTALLPLLAALWTGCATMQKASPSEKEGALNMTDVSQGLPREGLWRQDIVLADMNGDGLLDIVAPPPRKAAPAERRLSIFLQEKGGKWLRGTYSFPDGKGYDYGSVSVGDVNGDGLPDIALAVHTGRIVVLRNNGKGGFEEEAVPQLKDFSSRSIALADMNGDGWPDIVSFAEFPRQALQDSGRAAPPPGKGILLALNKEGRGWEARLIEGSGGIFGDSFAIGNISGSGKKDIVIGPQIAVKGFIRDKTFWFGDGKGNFKRQDVAALADLTADFARAGDLDGDGVDEAVLRVSGFGAENRLTLKAFKWVNAEARDISPGLEAVKTPAVFDLADVDGDGQKELVVLDSQGLAILKYRGGLWSLLGKYALPVAEISGSYDLRAARQKDGSVLIVYNLGGENTKFGKGIRAYLLK